MRSNGASSGCDLGRANERSELWKEGWVFRHSAWLCMAGNLALQLSLLEDLGSRYKGHGQSTVPVGQVRGKAEIVVHPPPDV